MRRQAKAVNFGIVYGISDYGLSQSLNITRKKAYLRRCNNVSTYPSAFASLTISDMYCFTPGKLAK
jgi:DNA polymerase I-like protein with 3'-5' exonuclease and polymerase domains